MSVAPVRRLLMRIINRCPGGGVRGGIAAVIVGLTLSLEPRAAEWRLTGGFDYSSGDYGDAVDTDILFLPLSISRRQGEWKSRITTSWLRISGPGSVIGAGDTGVVLSEAAATSRTTESGAGDTWVSQTYTGFTLPGEALYLDVTGKVKLPTADEDRGLGTGEVDYTLQADLFAVHGRFTPMARIAYKIRGDPAGSELDNVWYLSVGTDYRIDESLNGGATLDYQQASTASADDAWEVFTYLGLQLNTRWSTMVYGYGGLSDGSPDYGAGMQISYRF